MDKDTILLQWKEAREAREAWEIRERDLRTQSITLNFGRLDVGVSNIELGAGWKLRATQYQRYEIKKNAGGDYSHIPHYLAQLSQEAAFGLIKWKPELNKEMYDSLTHEERVIANNFVTIVDNAPTLEIVQPSA